MSCYSPMVGLPSYNLDGSKHIQLVGHRDDYGVYKYVKFEPNVYEHYPDAICIPCGQCLGCRLDYSRAWADRMLLELISNNQAAIFLTLTYRNSDIPYAVDDSDVPVSFSLCYRDVQLFLKRLRKCFCEKKIRFVFAGEYGSRTKRPHYHAIIYGLTLDDFPARRVVGVNELSQSYFSDSALENLWGKGFVAFSSVTYKTCAYVSRYNVKKIYGDGAMPSEYAAKPFLQMSRRPGIAGQYLLDHPDVYSTSNIYVPTDDGAQKIPLPRYYLRRLRLDNPDRYDIIMSERSSLAKARSYLKVCNTDLSYIDQLELEQEELMRRVKPILSSREEVLL